MTIEQRNKLTDKALEKKDGVYSYQGYKYAVKNNRMIAYSDYMGNMLTCHGAFNVVYGKVKRSDISKILKQIIKNS